MADGDADEDAVGELGHLDGHDRREMCGVAEFLVEGEELLEGVRDVGRGQEVGDGELGGGGVDEVDACVVASDVEVAGGDGVEAAGEKREDGEGAGEGGFEVRDESVGRERGCGVETSLLDVVAAEHVEV